jgi:serine phosphatase RsbU (regulator of sigma subunit)
MSRLANGNGSAARLVIDAEGTSLRGDEFLPKTREQELELKLAALQKEYADLHAGLFEAAHVHRRLCAPRLVRHGAFEIASETFAARHLPGDFIAVRESADSALLALGDISGKGLAAGMWTSLLLGLLGIHAGSSDEPESVVAGMNRDICRTSVAVPLASFFLGKLDSTSGRLDYCSAGHPPALLLREDGQLEMLSDGGPLLGAFSSASFVKGSVNLQAGDVLAVYSDGLLEARDDSEQEFGFDRLESQVRCAGDGSAGAVLFSVLGAVQDFVGGYPQADDMSVVVVRHRTS